VIIIHNCNNINDEFHNLLSLLICWKGFPTKHAHLRHILGISILGDHFFHLLVSIDYSHDIQKLSLVFMNVFDLIFKYKLLGESRLVHVFKLISNRDNVIKNKSWTKIVENYWWKNSKNLFKCYNVERHRYQVSQYIREVLHFLTLRPPSKK
jgi:hypothetical protein